jgi:hypothetical protein
MEGANRDAPSNRITTTNATAIVSVSADVDGNTPDAVKFVNDGRRAVRDGWRGAGLPDIDTIAVGSDGSGLSRSNTDLVNQTNSATASESLPDATTVTYDVTLTQTGVEEVGLFTSSGTLIARVTFASPVDVDGPVSVSLSVGNDDSVSRGVLTADGQTATRDILADNSPTLPNAYAYGSDGTAVAESDTALGNELVDVSLEDILIQDAATTAGFDDLVGSIADDEPLSTAGGSLSSLQIGDTRDDSGSDSRSLTNLVVGDEYNDGDATEFISDGGFVEFEVSFDYRIPSSEVGIQVRDETNNSTDVDFLWDGQVIDTNQSSGLSLGWHKVSNGFYQGGGFGYDAIVGQDIEPGETHTVRVEIQQVPQSEEYIIDAIAVYDERYESELDFPNPDAATNAGGILDGPQQYRLNNTVGFATADTRRNVTESSFSLTANDVSNTFYVELANDGSTFTRVDNSQTGSVTFASPDRGVDTNLNLSRYTSDGATIPATGDSGQSVSAWELRANPDAIVPDDIGVALARAIVPPNTITGDTVREAGIKSDSTLLTRHELAEFEVLADQRLASSESTRFTGDE